MPEGLTGFVTSDGLADILALWSRADSHNMAVIGDAGQGQKLFESAIIGAEDTSGCLPCHPASLEGAAFGPRQIGMTARSAAAIKRSDYTGQAGTVAAYLAESVMAPDIYVTPGYTPGLMPNDYATILTEQQLADLVAFMLTLK